ncbi:inositol-3-phosphate synthase, putative [Plasmodium gallinaceum]|uniref:inositol-3-phosphate synthase n=1 Tax=Plasmodium gallinaceum TaxID=5849 RepID=A0A1J1GZA0_PLAGA|nr:inositol-3-phosphate synthase, putative [Plasmodium gallinaceum]CRG97894.1 inositol-3-phosphate synthase, putative [Plasmodium gallinaceum]
MTSYKGLNFCEKNVGNKIYGDKEDYKIKLNRKEDEDFIYSTYEHVDVEISKDTNGNIACNENKKIYEIMVEKIKKEKKLGVLIIGIGGNNSTTLLGGICANSKNLTYINKYDLKKPNYLGSIFLSSNIRLGYNQKEREHSYCPIHKLVDFYNPKNIVYGGWDINNLNLKDCLIRNKVFEYDLIEKIKNYLDYIPLKSVYFKGNFISDNQQSRVNNILIGQNKLEILEKVRDQIRNFQKYNDLDDLIILWSGNTEKNIPHIEGINDTLENILCACKNNHPSISPSMIYALAAVLENAPFINSSPQNTFVNAIVQLAKEKRVFIIGNDLKTGQTKIKNFLLDFYYGTGLKPKSIVSYNHLGNNDGKNLSSSLQFHSKKISKSNLICDYVKANEELYDDQIADPTFKENKEYSHVDSLNEVCNEYIENEKEKEVFDGEYIEKQKVNSEIVIKYVPYVGDDKKAIDEYISEIFMNGKNTIVLYNICQDSLLASPILIDLILLVELSQRINFKCNEKNENIEEINVNIKIEDYQLSHKILKPKYSNYKQMDSILFLSSIFCKSPFNSDTYKTRHSFFSQLESLSNFIRIISGLPIDAQIDLPYMI